jgi:hypothetical protein
MVAGTDSVLDRIYPQGASQRHALGVYAIELAEREDRGEITREQAEGLYQAYMQQNPVDGDKPSPELKKSKIGDGRPAISGWRTLSMGALYQPWRALFSKSRCLVGTICWNRHCLNISRACNIPC